MRLLGTETPTTIALLGVFVFLAFTGLLMGIGELTHRIRLYLMLSFCIPVLTLILYLAGAPVYSFTVFFLLPYLIITVVLVGIGLKYKLNMGLLLIGWVIILVANMGLAVGILDVFTSPLLASLGKVFIFYWMTQPYFSTFAEGFEAFISEPTSETVPRMEQYVTMVETSSSMDTLGWIKDRIISKEASMIRSILFLTECDEEYDTSELDALDNLYIFKITEGYRKSEQVFSKHIMEISSDVSEISVLIYDLLEHIRVNKVSAQIFFFDISRFIKRNGWRRVYSQMISLIPQFKSATLYVHFIYNQDNLENKYILEIIRHLADNVIKLED